MSGPGPGPGPGRPSPPAQAPDPGPVPAATIPKIKLRNPSSPAPSPDTHASHDKYAPKPQTSVSLADTIGPNRSISSFSSFTRLNPATARLLDDLTARMTLLAPLNSAIDHLPRKPWQPPPDDQDHPGHDVDAQDRARNNLDRFVRAHILMGTAPWEEGVQAETLTGGRPIWWEARDDGVRVVCPDGIEVERVAARVANGELWIVKGVLDYK
ncbi:hypothetical protein E4U42_008096 [Claviceps africana]|uniref:FAS1 domain-containing protein n=1 Tax=Claviceps africana TaxID=83212 RepID=A0A8K0J108_9HYPO|nr:hypothetical protein E4U42_008096 [Claviceps africana]